MFELIRPVVRLLFRIFFRFEVLGLEHGLRVAAQSPFWNDPGHRFRRICGIDPVSTVRFDDEGFVIETVQE